VLIDCETCVVRGDGCADCVVTALLGPLPVAELGQESVTALAVLAEAGMLPPLRLIPGGAAANRQSLPHDGNPAGRGGPVAADG
jgi:hypothetical protein